MQHADATHPTPRVRSVCVLTDVVCVCVLTAVVCVCVHHRRYNSLSAAQKKKWAEKEQKKQLKKEQKRALRMYVRPPVRPRFKQFRATTTPFHSIIPLFHSSATYDRAYTSAIFLSRPGVDGWRRAHTTRLICQPAATAAPSPNSSRRCAFLPERRRVRPAAGATPRSTSGASSGCGARR